jgi:hypothetical protein
MVGREMVTGRAIGMGGIGRVWLGGGSWLSVKEREEKRGEERI